MSINILVIDDDVKIAQRLMNGLKRADSTNEIGDIKVDDSIIKVESIEKYDTTGFGIHFDVALIDYQLCSSFTGILVSAWIALYLEIPRLTITTAAYPGNPDYFNGFILKNEITDNPNLVIEKITECVANFNSKVWLEKQHHALVLQYQELLGQSRLGASPELSSLQAILDQFEKILDARQESEIKKRLHYELESDCFKTKEAEISKSMQNLSEQLDHYIEELSKHD